MPEHRSFPIRIAAKHRDDDAVSQPIEDKLYTLSRAAAGTVTPGMTVKAQRLRAWENLGRPPMWRLLSAWYRDGSASWSAAAVFDFERRFTEWRKRESARSTAAAATERAKRVATERAAIAAYIEHHRAETAKLEARLSTFEEAGSD